MAERAIGGLKHTVRDINENLGDQLNSAAQLSQQLKKQLAEGDNVIRRLSRIVVAARPAAEPEPAAPKISAAQAAAPAAPGFSHRARCRGPPPLKTSLNFPP